MGKTNHPNKRFSRITPIPLSPATQASINKMLNNLEDAQHAIPPMTVEPEKVPDSDIVLYQIQKGIPVPNKNDKDAMEVIRKKMLELADAMEVGDAIAIRSTQTETIRKLFREQRPGMGFKFSPIKPEKTFTRIWRMI